MDAGLVKFSSNDSELLSYKFITFWRVELETFSSLVLHGNWISCGHVYLLQFSISFFPCITWRIMESMHNCILNSCGDKGSMASFNGCLNGISLRSLTILLVQAFFSTHAFRYTNFSTICSIYTQRQWKGNIQTPQAKWSCRFYIPHLFLCLLSRV